MAEATKRRLVFASLRGYINGRRCDRMSLPGYGLGPGGGLLNDAGRRLAVQGARPLSTRDH